MIILFQINIKQEDIENVLSNGEIIEEYENDYPYPSYLIYGINLNNEVLHLLKIKLTTKANDISK